MEIKKARFFSDISIWWDIGKTKIKSLTRNFCVEQNFSEQSKLMDIEGEITSLQNSMSDPDKLLELQEKHSTILIGIGIIGIGIGIIGIGIGIIGIGIIGIGIGIIGIGIIGIGIIGIGIGIIGIGIIGI